MSGINESKKLLESRLLWTIQQQENDSMLAVKLVDEMTKDGTPEMDVREALLSLMVSGKIYYTPDRCVEKVWME